MQEPISISVALGACLSTGVALVALLVPGIDQATQLAVIGFGNALIALGVAIFARARSTPTANPVLPIGSLVTSPDGDLARVTPAPLARRPS